MGTTLLSVGERSKSSQLRAAQLGSHHRMLCWLWSPQLCRRWCGVWVYHMSRTCSAHAGLSTHVGFHGLEASCLFTGSGVGGRGGGEGLSTHPFLS